MKTILKFSCLLLVLIVIACSGSDDSPSCTEQTWYLDADGDTFGNASVIQNSCTQPAGYVLDNTDCDDADSSTNPEALEVTDGQDNDCDGLVDECVDNSSCGAEEICVNGMCETATTYYADVDGDGFGDSNNSIESGNVVPSGYVLDSTDCNDFDASVNPAALEIPDNAVDEDCDAQSSKDYTFYADNDGDGYGDPNNSIVASCPAPCNDETQMTIPNGYVFNNLDCNDTNINTNPFAIENTTDGVDNNCNGNTDVIYYYQDVDGDGFGNVNDSGTTVDFVGSSQNNTDCDDNNANIFFGAPEVQDGIDNNCNGLIDEF